MRPDFEFDAAKSESNRDKHGIDFETAQALWDDRRLAVSDALHPVEPRLLATGRLGRKFWTAVFTIRGQKVRLISVRRARSKEIAAYGAKDS